MVVLQWLLYGLGVQTVAGIERERPLPRVRSGWPAGLPIPLTEFVGRERERAEVARLVAANRLTTLTGAGGVGKTRLAVEVAAGLFSDFGDGVGLIDLSAVTEPSLLPGAVARGLGVEERSGTGLDERLLRVLREQHRLVVLDNCEHLRTACGDLAVAVLGSCPGVVVLATSRESLGLPGEVTWRVPSLTFPWPEHPPALEDLESFEAVALFLTRARAARPGLRVGPGEAAAITSICYRLDGIPLALELAAARVGALSLTEIAERLTGRFELLGRSGVGPPRQQTLRASVEWSHQLLSEPERALLRRLAVFSGGWTLGAAEAVCDLPPVGQDHTAGLLAALVDKSLVQAEQTQDGTRYRLVEVIRGFAGEQLAESGELDQVRARHAGYYTDLAQRSAPMLYGAEQACWVNRLDADTPNLRAARRWCEEDPARAGTGLLLASALWDYLHIRGRLVEAADWLEKALADDSGPAQARGVALLGLGATVAFWGDYDRSRELFTRSIEVFRDAGDLRGEARAWAHLGNALLLGRPPASPAQAYRRGLELAREAGDIWVEAYALFSTGFVMAASGDVARSRAPLATASELFGRAGDRRGYGYTRLAVGQALAYEGKAAEAVAVLREAVGIFEALRDRWGLLWGASLLAPACAAMGDWVRAVMLLGVVDSMSERTSGRPLDPDQASLDELEARAGQELGLAFEAARQAGRVLGRGDQVTAALWPARDADHDPAAGPDRGAGAGQAASHELPLTRREREVADLITRGLTNRQIGAQLFIAERTVDTHVGRILDKLGCASRAQVAAIVTAAAALTTAAPGAQQSG
jgi:predicted ATPase/DNA-binding CsgD family transcriptional regulator